MAYASKLLEEPPILSNICRKYNNSKEDLKRYNLTENITEEVVGKVFFFKNLVTHVARLSHIFATYVNCF